MSKLQTSETQTKADFNIKHRLVGAGVLIIFGALVLPWMLGPPNANIGGEPAHAARQSDLDVELEAQAADLEADFEGQEAEETVYISKITPLDGQGGSSGNAKQVQKPKVAVSQTKAVEEKPAPKIEEKKVEPVATDTKAAVQEVKDKAEQTDTSVADKPSDVKPVDAESVQSLEVGWVVQVGLFSTSGYEVRAKKLVNDLVGDGFKADSSLVETNRGQGMRVWLGPFAKRAEATKEVERLKGLTGKDGFVRVYP